MSNKDHLEDLSLDADMSEGIKGGVGVPPPPAPRGTAPKTAPRPPSATPPKTKGS